MLLVVQRYLLADLLMDIYTTGPCDLLFLVYDLSFGVLHFTHFVRLWQLPQHFGHLGCSFWAIILGPWL